MTIEELASQVGMTVRNVRAYNSAGLLSPPTLKGRLGLYGDEHLMQLQVIRTLRGQGISLERIKAVFTESGDQSGLTPWLRLGNLARTLTRHLPPDSEPQRISVESFEDKWQENLTPAMIELMHRSGLQRILPGGTIERDNPEVEAVADRMVELGIHLEQALEIQATISRELRLVVRSYLRLLLSALSAQQTGHSPGHASAEAMITEGPQLLMQAIKGMLPVLLSQETQRMAELEQSIVPLPPLAQQASARAQNDR